MRHPLWILTLVLPGLVFAGEEYAVFPDAWTQGTREVKTVLVTPDGRVYRWGAQEALPVHRFPVDDIRIVAVLPIPGGSGLIVLLVHQNRGARSAEVGFYNPSTGLYQTVFSARDDRALIEEALDRAELARDVKGNGDLSRILLDAEGRLNLETADGTTLRATLRDGRVEGLEVVDEIDGASQGVAVQGTIDGRSGLIVRPADQQAGLPREQARGDAPR